MRQLLDFALVLVLTVAEPREQVVEMPVRRSAAEVFVAHRNPLTEVVHADPEHAPRLAAA